MGGDRPADGQESLTSSRRQVVSPLRALTATIGAIFLANFVAMSVIAAFGPQTFLATTLLDGLIMVLLASPILFVIVFWPMIALVEAHDRTEQGLETTNERLRAQIQQRERAQETLQRHATEQAALYAVTAAATRRLDVDALGAEVTDVALELFEADAGWLIIPGDPASELPRVAAAKRAPEALVAAEVSDTLARCDRCGSWFTDGLQPGESPIVADCPRLTPALLTSAGFAGHIGVMLTVGSRVLGTLNLAWREPRALSDAEQSLVVRMARQIGLALENALLYCGEKRARQSAETIRAASLAVARTLDFEDVLNTLLGHLHKLVAHDRAKIMLLEGNTKLRVQAVSDGGAATFLGHRGVLFDVASNPIIEEVLTSTRGVLIPDIHDHPQWGTRARPKYERSWMGIPLVSGDAAIGLYTLTNAEPSSFTVEDMRLAEGLAGPASISVVKALLFREVLAGRERQQTLSRRLVELQEDERRRVSRELHDEAGQALTSMLFNLRLLKRDAGADAALIARTEDLEHTVEDVQQTIHRVATGLRPVALDHLGLVPALTQLVDTLANRGGPNVAIETVGIGSDRLPAEVETALYRVAQEALTNAVRHAAATEIAVILERRDGHLSLLVEDDGKGIEDLPGGTRGRLGMMGMRERVETLGGTFTVESVPGRGTTIVAEVPDDR